MTRKIIDNPYLLSNAGYSLGGSNDFLVGALKNAYRYQESEGSSDFGYPKSEIIEAVVAHPQCTFSPYQIEKSLNDFLAGNNAGSKAIPLLSLRPDGLIWPTNYLLYGEEDEDMGREIAFQHIKKAFKR